eukprot:Hpha_TRINITY_DN14338_c0_g1::TRINITY_DN14338_c0_g1_i1::g.86465::m.86465
MGSKKEEHDLLLDLQNEDTEQSVTIVGSRAASPTQTIISWAPNHAREAPRHRGFWARAGRKCFMEFVGTFVANLLSLGVITTSVLMNVAAQTHTMLDTVPAGKAMPPGAAAVPQVIPDATGEIPIPVYPGHASPAANHLYIVFPQQTLFLAIGIGFSFMVGLIVAPGCSLNPTFAVAIAMFQKSERATAVFAVLGQVGGAVVACWLNYAMGWELMRMSAPGVGGYDLGNFEKSVQNAQLYGVILPPDTLPFATCFMNTIVFVMLMVFAIVPALAGKGLHRAAKPFLVAALIVPFVMAQSPFGVQNNPGMYIGGLIFTSMAGWPSSMWTAADNYVVCVATAPFLGGILGGVVLKAWAWVIYNPDSPIGGEDEDH